MVRQPGPTRQAVDARRLLRAVGIRRLLLRPAGQEPLKFPEAFAAPFSPGRRARSGLMACVLGLAAALASLALAEGVDLQQLSTQRAEDGLNLSYSARFELPHSAEYALTKGVPIYFTVEAAVFRSRWYWRDARVAKASRTWRVACQPLTDQCKVSSGGLSQTYATRAEALATVRDIAGWHIADAREIEDSGGYYLEFGFRLDTSQLPRPMQIGLGAPQGWGLSIERSVTLNPDFSIKP